VDQGIEELMISLAERVQNGDDEAAEELDILDTPEARYLRVSNYT
jgi:hypothetical protein